MLQDVSRRLGFKFTLKASEIETIFDACRYEQAWVLDRASVWCLVNCLFYIRRCTQQSNAILPI